jgi:hypothetical protein
MKQYKTPNIMSVDLVISPATSTEVLMNINDNGTLGTAMSLPLATTSDAGLLSADDKNNLDNLNANAILQNGNSFGGPVVIGSLTSDPINFTVGLGTVGILDSTGNLALNSISNLTDPSNALIDLNTTGTVITRSANDNNTTLTVNRNGGTGTPQEWLNGGGLIAFVDSGGTFGAAGIKNPNGSNLAYMSLSSTGAVISRSIVDSNPPLIVNRNGGSGNIQGWEDAGTQVAFVDGSGFIACAGIRDYASSNNAQID